MPLRLGGAAYQTNRVTPFFSSFPICQSATSPCYGLEMGVHGLTTYLRENQRVLGKTRQFPPTSASEEITTTIVVDGWS